MSRLLAVRARGRLSVLAETAGGQLATNHGQGGGELLVECCGGVDHQTMRVAAPRPGDLLVEHPCFARGLDAQRIRRVVCLGRTGGVA